MTHKVLALKFRPQVFQDIIGQEHITITLRNSLKNKRFGHAYLFSGPRGVGKTTTARILAKSFNCEKGVSDNPCNICQNCIDITKSSSIDVEEIDGASNRGIDEIRELKEKTKYYPLNSKYKIFIIDEVHMLTDPAFNALLKILEEPPDFVIFIFATTEPHKIPVTILSRCQRFDFKRLSITKIVENFKNILKKENIEIPENILFRVAKKSEGSMRDGLSLLEQVINFFSDNEAKEFVDEILGYIDVSLFNKILEDIISNNHKNIISTLNDLYYNGVDFKEFSKDFIEFLENLIMLSYFPENVELIDDTEENINEMLELLKKTERFFLQTFLDFYLKEYNNIKFSEFPEVNVKLLFLKVMEISNLKSIDEIISILKSSKNIPVDNSSAKTVIAENPQGEYIVKKEKFIWNKFLSFISHEKPSLYGLLNDAKVSDKGDELIIEINKNLPDSEKVRNDIKSLIKKFNNEDKNVIIQISKELSFKHKVLQNEVINDILNLFDGEIDSITTKA